MSSSRRAWAMAVLAAVSLAACQSTSADPEPPSSSTTSTTAARAANRSQSGCDGPGALEADVDGDGGLDRAHHSYDGGDTVLGVCLADGRTAMLAGVGMTEVLSAVDVEGDGRTELLYGGTSACEAGAYVAVWDGEALRRVVRADGKDLLLTDGCDGDGAATAWGCRDGRFVQVRVEARPSERVLGWRSEEVRLDGAVAVVVSARTGTRDASAAEPNDGLQVPDDLRPPRCAGHD